jgi:hypothetical protein
MPTSNESASEKSEAAMVFKKFQRIIPVVA